MKEEVGKVDIETENERQMSRLLARAIWIATKRSSGETDEPSSEKMRAEWNSAKPQMDRIADMTIRRLKAKNVELIQK